MNDRIQEEAKFFSKQNSELARAVGWKAIPQFHRKIQSSLNLVKEAQEMLPKKSGLKALTLACGDMKSEYQFLSRMGAASIDAFDIAEDKRKDFFEKYHDGSIEVDYQLQDINKLELPVGKYDVVYMQQSYHHIMEVEHLAEQIRKALQPEGIFVLVDYVGPNFLQRSERQLAVARRIWKLLPERLRTHPSGKVVKDVFIPAKETLPPCEAINSESILSALERNFDYQKVHLFGGILFPLFNGFAQNYTDDEDLFLQAMWEMDEVLIENKVVEANFIRAIMTPKHNNGKSGDGVVESVRNRVGSLFK